MSKIKYVLLVVATPDLSTVVGLTKKKGPSFLVNRITFPGGKLDGEESPTAAASREMREETGLEVPESAWTTVYQKEGHDHLVYVMAATSKNALYAKQLEEEPVWLLDVEAHIRYQANQPAQYALDFKEVLEKSIEALSAKHSEAVAA